LQCVAVCCSVLQCVAVRCSALQCVAVCCSVLQCVSACCSVLQCRIRCSPCRCNATHDMQHTTCNTRHASHDMHHTTCITRHATHDMHHTTCITRHASHDMHHTTCIIQCSISHNRLCRLWLMLCISAPEYLVWHVLSIQILRRCVEFSAAEYGFWYVCRQLSMGCGMCVAVCCSVLQWYVLSSMHHSRQRSMGYGYVLRHYSMCYAYVCIYVHISTDSTTRTRKHDNPKCCCAFRS